MEQKQVTEELKSFQLPAWNEIPDVGLYLDQVTKYINSYLGDYEMGVTPSMISNYVKLKIISREGKKIYSRERIAALIFVAVTKTVLSMDQIRDVLAEFSASDSHEAWYTAFVQSLKKHLSEFELQALPKAGREENGSLLGLITAAVAHKIYLDTYFRRRRSEKTSG